MNLKTKTGDRITLATDDTYTLGIISLEGNGIIETTPKLLSEILTRRSTWCGSPNRLPDSKRSFQSASCADVVKPRRTSPGRLGRGNPSGFRMRAGAQTRWMEEVNQGGVAAPSGCRRHHIRKGRDTLLAASLLRHPVIDYKPEQSSEGVIRVEPGPPTRVAQMSGRASGARDVCPIAALMEAVLLHIAPLEGFAMAHPKNN